MIIIHLVTSYFVDSEVQGGVFCKAFEQSFSLSPVVKSKVWLNFLCFISRSHVPSHAFYFSRCVINIIITLVVYFS
jgi:hypothetical protein